MKDQAEKAHNEEPLSIKINTKNKNKRHIKYFYYLVCIRHTDQRGEVNLLNIYVVDQGSSKAGFSGINYFKYSLWYINRAKQDKKDTVKCHLPPLAFRTSTFIFLPFQTSFSMKHYCFSCLILLRRLYFYRFYYTVLQ